jgi:hypothetical protein
MNVPDERCPRCVELGLESAVTQGQTNSTAMGLNRFEDELGAHVHDPNGKLTYFRCSQGHLYGRVHGEPCSVDSCPYGRDTPRLVDIDPQANFYSLPN